MKKFCPYCGKEIENLAGFCPYCGKRLGPRQEPAQFSGTQAPQTDIRKALEKIRCKLSPAEVFAILGFSQADLINWQIARWARHREEESNILGIIFLTQNNVFFVSRALWPAKLSKKQIERDLLIIPTQTIKKAKIQKALFNRRPIGVKIWGRVNKRGIILRKTSQEGREIFRMQDPEIFIRNLKTVNPRVEIV